MAAASRAAAASVGHVLMAPSCNALGISEASFGCSWHQEAREFVGTSLIAWANPKDAASTWIALAHEQLCGGALQRSAARRSLQRALRQQHQLETQERCDALLLLAGMLLAIGRPRVVVRAERLVRAALAAVPADPTASWRLGQLLIHRGGVRSSDPRPACTEKSLRPSCGAPDDVGLDAGNGSAFV
jgi:hypothetical protein